MSDGWTTLTTIGNAQSLTNAQAALFAAVQAVPNSSFILDKANAFYDWLESKDEIDDEEDNSE